MNSQRPYPCTLPMIISPAVYCIKRDIVYVNGIHGQICIRVAIYGKTHETAMHKGKASVSNIQLEIATRMLVKFHSISFFTEITFFSNLFIFKLFPMENEKFLFQLKAHNFFGISLFNCLNLRCFYQQDLHFLFINFE